MGNDKHFVNEEITLTQVDAPHATYLMPPDIAELIERGKRGELNMDYVIGEVTRAAEGGHVGIVEDIA
jgi:hypothetical protein